MAFVRVAKVADVPPGSIHQIDAGGRPLALANVGGTFRAIDGTCLHRGGPLGEGTLEGTVVTCPWHGWQFDVVTGKNALNPAAVVACLAVEVRGDEVFVDVG
jgi:nitrite reductase (NADH) small subunit/3-phenylpropionate/trans-cinnamate dioxygenase ferredoxin subunit